MFGPLVYSHWLGKISCQRNGDEICYTKLCPRAGFLHLENYIPCPRIGIVGMKCIFALVCVYDFDVVSARKLWYPTTGECRDGP